MRSAFSTRPRCLTCRLLVQATPPPTRMPGPKHIVHTCAGANIGLFSLRACEAVGSGGHVIAVEALPPTFDRLAQNLGSSLNHGSDGSKASRRLGSHEYDGATAQGAALQAKLKAPTAHVPERTEPTRVLHWCAPSYLGTCRFEAAQPACLLSSAAVVCHATAMLVTITSSPRPTCRPRIDQSGTAAPMRTLYNCAAASSACPGLLEMTFYPHASGWGTHNSAAHAQRMRADLPAAILNMADDRESKVTLCYAAAHDAAFSCTQMRANMDYSHQISRPERQRIECVADLAHGRCSLAALHEKAAASSASATSCAAQLIHALWPAALPCAGEATACHLCRTRAGQCRTAEGRHGGRRARGALEADARPIRVWRCCVPDKIEHLALAVHDAMLQGHSFGTT